ncbi:HTH-type transcriptional activator Btr [compost metagenome]
MRPMEYVNQQRVNRSKQLMFHAPERKMYEIAKQVGFENASYFCSVFRRKTGMSPDSFKKLHGLGR